MDILLIREHKVCGFSKPLSWPLSLVYSSLADPLAGIRILLLAPPLRLIAVTKFLALAPVIYCTASFQPHHNQWLPLFKYMGLVHVTDSLLLYCTCLLTTCPMGPISAMPLSLLLLCFSKLRMILSIDRYGTGVGNDLFAVLLLSNPPPTNK
jgi:hypothetical protein